jgi:hypothetical protein
VPSGVIAVRFAASVAIPRAASRLIRPKEKNPQSTLPTVNTFATPLLSQMTPVTMRSVARPRASAR